MLKKFKDFINEGEFNLKDAALFLSDDELSVNSKGNYTVNYEQTKITPEKVIVELKNKENKIFDFSHQVSKRYDSSMFVYKNKETNKLLYLRMV